MANHLVITYATSAGSAATLRPGPGLRWKVIHATIVLNAGAGVGTRRFTLQYAQSAEGTGNGFTTWLDTGAQAGVSTTYVVSQSPSGGLVGSGRTLVAVNPYLEFGDTDTIYLNPTLVSGDKWSAYFEVIERVNGEADGE